MADEGEDTESLQGLLPPEVEKSPEGSGESGRSGGGGCEGLEGPFLTEPGSQESIETSETDRLCENHDERDSEMEDLAALQSVGEGDQGGVRTISSSDYRLHFSHGGEGGLLIHIITIITIIIIITIITATIIIRI